MIRPEPGRRGTGPASYAGQSPGSHSLCRRSVSNGYGSKAKPAASVSRSKKAALQT